VQKGERVVQKGATVFLTKKRLCINEQAKVVNERRVWDSEARRSYKFILRLFGWGIKRGRLRGIKATRSWTITAASLTCGRFVFACGFGWGRKRGILGVNAKQESGLSFVLTPEMGWIHEVK